MQGLLEKTEKLTPKLSKIYPSAHQWNSLGDLSTALLEAVQKFQEEVRLSRESRTQRAWQESEVHRSKVQSSRSDLLATCRLRHPSVFRRNIVLIYEGPKTSRFDSEDSKLRKESTRKRSKLIRDLKPDGVISWAIALAPTLWAGGSMASDLFTCILDSVEPEVVQRWPPVIRDTLYLLMEDEESLSLSSKYGELLQALDDPGRHDSIQNSKRRRVEDGDMIRPCEIQSPLLQHLPGNISSDGDLSSKDSRQGRDDQERSTSENGSGTPFFVEQVPPPIGDKNVGQSHLRRHPDSSHSSSPSKENREMKHMYTNALASNISKLPEPFRAAIENSRLWKWERSQNCETTGCWAALFPKDDTQDVSFTIWCGNDDGYHLTNAFGAQHAISS